MHRVSCFILCDTCACYNKHHAASPAAKRKIEDATHSELLVVVKRQQTQLKMLEEEYKKLEQSNTAEACGSAASTAIDVTQSPEYTMLVEKMRQLVPRYKLAQQRIADLEQQASNKEMSQDDHAASEAFGDTIAALQTQLREVTLARDELAARASSVESNQAVNATAMANVAAAAASAAAATHDVGSNNTIDADKWQIEAERAQAENQKLVGKLRELFGKYKQLQQVSDDGTLTLYRTLSLPAHVLRYISDYCTSTTIHHFKVAIQECALPYRTARQHFTLPRRC
jgi:hypothetical protein